jgi:hypothetical protein
MACDRNEEEECVSACAHQAEERCLMADRKDEVGVVVMEEAGAHRRVAARTSNAELVLFATSPRFDGMSDNANVCTTRETNMVAETNLVLSDRCLAVFVDDTGHEALVAGHPVYGLGGCAALACDLDRVIRAPWREIRRRVTGSPGTPLHANTFPALATQDNIVAVAEFFRVNPFARFGAIISTDTTLAEALGPVPTIAKVLQARIVDIARWTTFDSLAVIFESSQRADPLIETAFQGFALEEGSKPFPAECYFMRKEHAEPALEVADFVMHAVGRQARQNLKKRGDFVPDFCAVFHAVDQRLTSFIEVTTVARNEGVGAC